MIVAGDIMKYVGSSAVTADASLFEWCGIGYCIVVVIVHPWIMVSM